MGVYEGMEAAACMGATGIHLNAGAHGLLPSSLDAVEREVGDDPVGDITRAVEFLKTL